MRAYWVHTIQTRHISHLVQAESYAQAEKLALDDQHDHYRDVTRMTHDPEFVRSIHPGWLKDQEEDEKC